MRKTVFSALGVFLAALGLSGDETRLPWTGGASIAEIGQTPTNTDSEPLRLGFAGWDEVSSECFPLRAPALALPQATSVQAEAAPRTLFAPSAGRAASRRRVLSFAPKTSPPFRS